MEKKINLSINEGQGFFAHEASINFSPTQFIMDFRCVTPRIDPRSNEAPTLHMAHNVVMIEPYHAKRVHELLSEMIEKYEKEFGKIEKTNAMKKIEKKKQKEKEKRSNVTKTAPSYFG
ncbi:DUF3467 domain-containing protein [Candidatus Woesearchaeota archaeon]|nr:DUF3467 domain-containing protein [Candidatus Woesearchaeota archaeon]